MTDDNDPDYCGLGKLVTGEHDPFWETSCKPHDKAFQDWKDGKPSKGLVRTTADWAVNCTKVFARGVWAVVGFPFYLIGGGLGGMLRWRFIRPEIKQDKPGGETF